MVIPKSLPEQPSAGFPATPRFQFVRRIGEGGMGIVFEAFDRVRSGRVALKTIRVATADRLIRFKNEFRTLQDLQHRNLVRLDELFEADGTWFFTMELVDGVDFLQYVRPDATWAVSTSGNRTREVWPSICDAPTTATVSDVPNPTRAAPRDDTPMAETAPASATAASFDEPRLREALRQLAVGLNALHAAGKVHRDVKPANILVTADDRLVLLDFGLVTEASPRPLLDGTFGTVSFMAPEQTEREGVGPAADWYAVGATLYRALTGRPPFLGTAEQVVALKRRVEPISPAHLVAGVPADLAALCIDLLRRDPGDRPAGREVLARLGVSPAAPELMATDAPRPVFVGRDGELGALRVAYTDAERSGPVAVLIHGESGIGKSALVREFLTRIADPSTLVLAGRCYERESVPYKAVDPVIDVLSRHLASLPGAEVEPLLPPDIERLAQVFPALRRIHSVDAAVARHVGRPADAFRDRLAVFDALRALFSRLGRRGRMVVTIDDLQWADADSLSLFAHLMHPPDAPTFLLVATVRSAAGTTADSMPLRTHLGRDVRDVAVGRLPPEAARELVASLLAATRSGDRTGRVAAVAAVSDGHPMFIEALVRHRVLHPTDDGAIVLDDAIIERAAGLDAAARRVLELVCLAGGPVAQEVCARAAGVPFAELIGLVTSLRAANLVATYGPRRADAIEPYHDRVREAVVASLTAETRRHGHARLGRALAASGHGDPEALAVHFREAGDAGRAARYAARAADRAASALAFERAVRLYQLALDLGADTPRRAERLQLGLAAALGNAGRGRDAAAMYLAVADRAIDADRLELRRRAAEHLLRSGYVEDGLSTLRDVLAAVGMHLPSTPRRALASLLFQRLRLRLRGSRFTPRLESDIPPEVLRRIDICFGVCNGLGLSQPVCGADFQTRNLRMSLDAGEPSRIARALAAEVCYTATAGGPAAPAVAALMARGRALSAAIGDTRSAGLVEAGGVLAAYLAGRWRDCLAQSELAERILGEGCTGAAWELGGVRLFAVRSLFYLGELAELRRRVDHAIEEASASGDLYLRTNLRLGVMVHAWLADDDADTARRHASDAMHEWRCQGVHLEHYYDLQAQASIDLYAGAPELAERRIAETWPRLSSALLLRVQLMRILCLHLRGRARVAAADRGHHGAGDPRLAQAMRDAALLAREKETPLGAPFADLIGAGVAACRGDAPGAADLLVRAEAALDANDMRLFAVAARRQRGRLLGGDEGRALIEASDAVMAVQRIASPERFADLLVPGFAGAGR